MRLVRALFRTELKPKRGEPKQVHLAFCKVPDLIHNALLREISLNI